ncbi:hypothetical protein COLO4_21367 [Corchorus olitorius]|uniref:Retrotransposon Copia-like N-terminal domain-containing protein n=1 Tax=Corchorus olitorius TaxID=93759 RepID=A0A1R3ITP5_9ROSI|nr:hypothetical protein COLO4_21367 [Corchorus olitorius]
MVIAAGSDLVDDQWRCDRCSRALELSKVTPKNDSSQLPAYLRCLYFPFLMATENTSPVAINASAQLPLKLTLKNFVSWRAQFDALLMGFNLEGYVEGTTQPPPKEIQKDGKTVSNPDYNFWLQQDKLILHAIIASTLESVLPCIASSKSSDTI